MLRIAILLAIALTPSLLHAQATFQGLGPGTLRDASRDGKIVLIQKSNGDVFRWRADTRTATLAFALPNGGSNAISNDGNVIVGSRRNASSNFIAYRWTAAGGFADLGELPGGSVFSNALAVSADGSAIAGHTSSTATGVLPGREAFRWTASNGLVALGHLGAQAFSEAQAISADGSVVVGYDDAGLVNPTDAFNRVEAYRWSPSSGMVGLGDLPGGVFNSQAHFVSSDGNVVVGHSNVAFDDNAGIFQEEAFRWTAQTGIQGLGIPTGARVTQAFGASADGSSVVGYIDYPGQQYKAFLWDPAQGMRSIQDILINDHHLNLAGWTLQGASRISDDALTITGTGINPLGLTEAWIATVPEPTGITLILPFLYLFNRRSRDFVSSHESLI